MTIESELNALDNTKAAIKQAIIDKGVSVPASTTFAEYPSKIALIETGSEPVLDSLTIAPSTTAQTITPPSGVDGYDDITVNAVTAAIDADIVAGNIKSGVEILGVTGNYTGEPVNLQSKTFAASSTTATLTTVTPDTGYDGLSAVTVDLSYIENRVDAINGTTVTPSGTTTITANGTYDVTNYVSANVSVSGGWGSVDVATLTAFTPDDEPYANYNVIYGDFENNCTAYDANGNVIPCCLVVPSYLADNENTLSNIINEASETSLPFILLSRIYHNPDNNPETAWWEINSIIIGFDTNNLYYYTQSY